MTSLVRRLQRPLVRRSLPDVDQLFRDLWLEPFTLLRSDVTPDALAWAPKLDLYETDNQLVAKVELPGVRKEDIEVVRENGHVAVRAEKKDEHEVEEEGYHRRERFHGRYERLIPLPVEVGDEEIIANFEDGVLEIRVPKLEPEPAPEPQKIEVR